MGKTEVSGNIWAKDGGIYLGYPADSTEGAPQWKNKGPVPYVGDRHLLTVGPNGSGKSRRLLLPNLANLTDWSVLVVDPKGELAHMTRAHREKNKNKIVILNPFNVLGLGSDGLNPVAMLDKDSEDFSDDALGLAEAIIRVQGQEPHWSESAQDLVTALIMYVRISMPGQGSLAVVRALLSKPAKAFRAVVEEMIEVGNRNDCEELAVKAGRFLDLTPDNKELNSIVSTALTQTRWLDSRPIKADLSVDSRENTAFDFSRMKSEPVTVYLILPARRLGTHSTWLRLMITSVLQPLMKSTGKADVPILLMLDEYFALAEGGFSVIEKNMAMFRGYGIKLWTVWQDLSQAHKLYGDNWESFAANAGVLQSFAPQDLVTAEYLSKRSGQTTKVALSSGQNRDRGGAPSGESVNFSSVQAPLMLPQDLRNMDDGYSVVFSHMTKGTGRVFFPFPKDMPHLKDICALDPAQ